MAPLIAPLQKQFDDLSSSPHRYRGKDGKLFFQLVGQLLRPDMVVVDYGAGRGRQAELYKEGRFQGRVRRVIGLDVDDAVMSNPYVDEAHLIMIGSRLPLENESVDLLFAYAVLEHVADPQHMADEIRRVLKPSGWFCAWTPYRWGYAGLGVQAIPNRYHARLLRIVAPDPSGQQRADEDVFPTLYRMNTVGALRRYLPDFKDASFTGNGEPSYNFGLRAMKLFWSGAMALGFRKALFAFMQKPAK